MQTRMDALPNLQPHHTVHFTMQSDHFSHAFQSTTFTVDKFRQDSARLRTYLQSLADKLNSNEEFEVDDSFSIEMTFTSNPGRGGRGKRHRGRRLGRTAIETLLKPKQTVVRILNTDDLCCARALVTMKTLAETRDARDPEYMHMCRGYSRQGVATVALHAQAGVPQGPCGLPELMKFQEVLPGYQIKVLSIDKPHVIIFEGPAADKKLLLIKVDDHYHGCTSFAGFLDKSYFCHDCNKGYNTENYREHPCDKLWCNACKQKDCEDFQTAKAALEPGKYPTPTSLCADCNRLFYGVTCLAYHRHNANPKRNPLFCMLKKCLSCHKHYNAARLEKAQTASQHHKYRHRCGWGECPFCLQQVDQATHQCYIQPVKPEDDVPDLKKVRADELGDRIVHYVDEEGGLCVYKSVPTFVYADYEATTDASGFQTPILLCCESEEDDTPHVYYGPQCTEEFFEYLDDLTVDAYGDSRQVIVLFHNLKGYDGMFILKYLYENHRDVEDQITVGIKSVIATQWGYHL